MGLAGSPGRVGRYRVRRSPAQRLCRGGFRTRPDAPVPAICRRAGSRSNPTNVSDMTDFFQNPFALPTGRAASTDPFGQLRPEDRWRLASDKVLGSNLGRRILGLPDRKPERNRGASADTAVEMPTGVEAGWDFGAGYEAISGWTVPLDADLKDLGRAALDNARRAGERPSQAGQVRAAERLRRTANSPRTGGNPAAGERTPGGSPRQASSPRLRLPSPTGW